MIEIFLEFLFRSEEGRKCLLRVIVIGLIGLMPVTVILGLTLFSTSLNAFLLLIIGIVAALAFVYFIDRKFIKDLQRRQTASKK